MVDFKPYSRLEHAKEVRAKCDDTEAAARGMIHQSYYMAFNHLARMVDENLLYPVDPVKKRTSVHAAYIEACKNKKDTLGSTHKNFNKLHDLAQQMNRLRGLRRRADYVMHLNVLMSEADLAVKTADAIYDLIEDLNQ